MTTRLNQGHRDALMTLAHRVVDCPAEAKAEEAAYQKAAAAVRKIVEKRFVPADMAVFKKYEMTQQDTCIMLQLTAGGVERFMLRSEDGVTVPAGSCNRRIYLTDEKQTELVTTWVATANALKNAKEKKLNDYRAFIQSSTTFEQVVEIWPEANELASRIVGNLPIAVSEETLAAITADAQRRLKATKKAA